MTLDIDDYKTVSWTVSKGVQDALWVLSAQIDKHNVPEFFEMIEVNAIDHLDNQTTPFVGVITSVDYTLAASANKAAVTGYDHGWYLTVQYIPLDERTTEVDTNPADTITTLLGGTAWATLTGIEPHRINNVAGWDSIKKSFEFGDKCTRWQAIKEICEYCQFVFVIKWRDVAGSWRPCAYFVHEDDIDSSTAGLDLPEPVTITAPDACMLSGVSVKDSPEHKYNRVLATGYDQTTETYFYATAETEEVTTGTAIAIEYVYADAGLHTQDATDVKAQELLDFFQASSKVYTASFNKRMDFELYQKIDFVGYNKIATGDMRITHIAYSRSASNDMVEIEFSEDQAIQQLKRLARVIAPDYMAGQQDMMNDNLADIGLIDAFDIPLTGEGGGGVPTVPLWEVDGSYVRLATARPIDIQGWSLDYVSGVRGAVDADISFWGYDRSNESLTEFIRWHNYELGSLLTTYLELNRYLYINTEDSRVYFDIDSFRPIYIKWGSTTHGQSMYLDIGGKQMMKWHNYTDPSADDFIGCYAKLICAEDIIVDKAIRGDGNNDLEFKVSGAGTFKFIRE